MNSGFSINSNGIMNNLMEIYIYYNILCERNSLLKLTLASVKKTGASA